MYHFEMHFDEIDGNDAFLKGIVEAHTNLLLDPLVRKYREQGTCLDQDLIRYEGDNVEAEFLDIFKAEYMKYTARFVLNPPVQRELQEAIPRINGSVKKHSDLDHIDRIQRFISFDEEFAAEDREAIHTFLRELEVYLGKPMGCYDLWVEGWHENLGCLEFTGINIMFGILLIRYCGYVLVLLLGSDL